MAVSETGIFEFDVSTKDAFSKDRVASITVEDTSLVLESTRDEVALSEIATNKSFEGSRTKVGISQVAFPEDAAFAVSQISSGQIRLIQTPEVAAAQIGSREISAINNQPLEVQSAQIHSSEVSLSSSIANFEPFYSQFSHNNVLPSIVSLT